MNLKEDPREMAPDVLKMMSVWIMANCKTYDDRDGLWYCLECDGQAAHFDGVRHSPECSIDEMLDLAKATGSR